MESPDNALMAQVRDGDVGRLAVLFERHHRPLFHYFIRLNGNRDLSEDLVQDVFFRMLRYRHTYKDGYPFTAWMYQIARNARIDHAQKRKAEVVSLEDRVNNSEEPASAAPGAEEGLRFRQNVSLLKRALARLPVEKREVLILSRYQNLKYEEIAGVLGCEVGTVKVRVYRAVRALSEIFNELAGERTAGDALGDGR
ncbi:MAG TPA: RNA polymerase sigma factor [Bryobacteraceae bacterium]|nr:RNA polymerase sigma factor [Bryobacteraceae bacterium]